MAKVTFTCGLAFTIAMLGGCSADGVKRVAYESVQGAGEEQCRKTQTPNCPVHASFDDYQRDRAALSTPEK
jgi:hypothetical protein